MHGTCSTIYLRIPESPVQVLAHANESSSVSVVDVFDLATAMKASQNERSRWAQRSN